MAVVGDGILVRGTGVLLAEPCGQWIRKPPGFHGDVKTI